MAQEPERKEKIVARIPSGASMEIRVTEVTYKDVAYIDIRKFYFDPPDKSTPQEDAKRPAEFFSPTRKGISLTAEQWKEALKAVKGLV